LLQPDGEAEPYHICFLAQQAAEKALKAALIYANQPFEPIHDLAALATQLPNDWRVRGAAPRLAKLSGYAVDTRYPDPHAQPGPDDAVQAVRDARAVYRAVCRDLQQHGMALTTRPRPGDASA
jgi:HEPN domain-containing protein